MVQRRGGVCGFTVVVCGTIDDSNFINRGLCLAGCTHEIASLGWVDDNRCRHFGGMIVVGAGFIMIYLMMLGQVVCHFMTLFVGGWVAFCLPLR